MKATGIIRRVDDLGREEINMDDFDTWLDENYCASEMINKSPEFYNSLTKEFIEYSIETITEEMLSEEWVEVEYTIK